MNSSMKCDGDLYFQQSAGNDHHAEIFADHVELWAKRNVDGDGQTNERERNTHRDGHVLQRGDGSGNRDVKQWRRRNSARRHCRRARIRSRPPTAAITPTRGSTSSAAEPDRYPGEHDHGADLLANHGELWAERDLHGDDYFAVWRHRHGNGHFLQRNQPDRHRDGQRRHSYIGTSARCQWARTRSRPLTVAMPTTPAALRRQ